MLAETLLMTNAKLTFQSSPNCTYKLTAMRNMIYGFHTTMLRALYINTEAVVGRYLFQIHVILEKLT